MSRKARLVRFLCHGQVGGRVSGEVCVSARGDIFSTVRIPAGGSAQNRHWGAGIRGLFVHQICGQIEIEGFISQRATIRQVCDGSGATTGRILHSGRGHQCSSSLPLGWRRRCRKPKPSFHREAVKCFHELGIAAFDPRHRKGVVVPNQDISVPLTVDGEVAVRQLVLIQSLGSTYIGTVTRRKRRRGRRLMCTVHLIRNQARSPTGGVVVGEIDVRTDNAPVVLAFIDGNRKH